MVEHEELQDEGRDGSPRLSRRRMLAWTAASVSAVALTGMLAACGGGDDTPSTSQGSGGGDSDGQTPSGGDGGSGGGDAGDGGTVIVGLVAEPVSLDPAQVSDINSMRVHSNIYDGLTAFELGTFNLKPALAKSWDISDDGLTYTFELRDDVTFHDGTPFNAEAAKFSFERILFEDHEYYNIGQYPFAAFYFGSVKEFEVVDEFTLTMHLSEPFAPLLNNLATATGFICSPEAIKTYGQDFTQNPVGTGPFKFVSWEHNVRVTLERNPDYWDGPPQLQNLVFRPITEEQTRLTELLSGGVNFIVDVPPDNIAQITSNDQFTFVEQPGPHIWWLSINHKLPPFDDVRVRQAINYAVNKEAIVKDVLKDTGTVANTVVPPAIEWAYNPDAMKYPYDPEKAKALLEEAGVGDGFTTTFWVTESGSGMQSPKTMAEAIQADLQAVGITANLEVMEWGAYLTKYGEGMAEEAGLAMMSWMFGSGDPDTVLPLSISSDAFSPNGYNTGYYQNDRVDELIKQARMVNDVEERGKLYREIQEITSEEAVWLFIDNAKQNAAMTADIKGFQLTPTFLLFFKDVTVG